MPVLDVCFIARAGITVPADIADALHYDTGATRVVKEPYYLVFPNPTKAVLTGAREVAEYTDVVTQELVTQIDPETGEEVQVTIDVTTPTITTHQVIFTLASGGEVTRNLELDHELTQPANSYPVYNDGEDQQVVNYRLRMAQSIERPVVTGGWKLIPGAQVGVMHLYRVRADSAALLRLHEWMTEDADNPLMHTATGALCVQDTTQAQTMETAGVYTRLNKNAAWWTARKAALATYCAANTTGDGPTVADTINAAANEPQLLLALLKAAAPGYSTAELISAFWQRW